MNEYKDSSKFKAACEMSGPCQYNSGLRQSFSFLFFFSLFQLLGGFPTNSKLHA